MEWTITRILLTALLAASTSALELTHQFQLRGNVVVDQDFFVKGELQPGETLPLFIKRYRKENGLEGTRLTRLDGSALSSPALATSSEPLGLASGASKILNAVDDSFSCEGLPYGYYSDISNSCHVYHVCQPVSFPSAVQRAPVIRVTLSASFFCNVGQVFDQRLLTCVTNTAAFDCAGQSHLFAASNSQFFHDVDFNAPGSDVDVDADQLYSVNGGVRDDIDPESGQVGEEFLAESDGMFSMEEEEDEQLRFVDLVKRSFRHIPGVKVVSKGRPSGSRRLKT